MRLQLLPICGGYEDVDSPHLIGRPHQADHRPLVGVLGLAMDDGQVVLVVHLLVVRP